MRVLHLFTTLDNGGVESFIYNYDTQLKNKDLQCDYVVPGEHVGFLEDYFIKRGSKIFHVPTLRNDIFGHWAKISAIIREGHYDVVHCHGYKSVEGLIFARYYGVKTRILHSHMAFEKESSLLRWKRWFITKLGMALANYYVACGTDAAKWLFGENVPVKILPNAIDLNRFRYSKKNRQTIRNELEIPSDAFVIGNVARLSQQKNQTFLLKVMKQLVKENPKMRLLLVGSGEDENHLHQMAKEYKIEKQVLFLGLRKDIPALLSALDVFALPSLYEGLPVVLAEVQASGLKTVVSDTVTKEIAITDLLTYLPIEETYLQQWCEELTKQSKSHSRRETYPDIMTGGAYDIQAQARQLYNVYCGMKGDHDEVGKR